MEILESAVEAGIITGFNYQIVSGQHVVTVANGDKTESVTGWDFDEAATEAIGKVAGKSAAKEAVKAAAESEKDATPTA